MPASRTMRVSLRLRASFDAISFLTSDGRKPIEFTISHTPPPLNLLLLPKYFPTLCSLPPIYHLNQRLIRKPHAPPPRRLSPDDLHQPPSLQLIHRDPDTPIRWHSPTQRTQLNLQPQIQSMDAHRPFSQ